VRDAKPLTKYTITPLSNGTRADSVSINTAAALPPNPSGLEPAYGIIRATNNQPQEGALVYLTVEGGQELSARTNPSGLWLIPLNQVRTKDLTGYLPTVQRMTENIFVQANDLNASAITDTLNDSPVPDMTIGKIYDFRRQQAMTTSIKTIALNPTGQLPTNGAVLGETTRRSFTVSLISPAQGAALQTTLPLIQGTGVPNTFVGISLGIAQIISGSTKVDANGLWNFTPPRTLATGKQSVTISAINDTGHPVAITHTFQIMKSGTQVLGDATPSATLTPQSTPEETVTPTTVAEPTSTLSGQPPPTSGNELPTILLLILGIGLCTGGVLAIL
jgi:hypothetical protein